MSDGFVLTFGTHSVDLRELVNLRELADKTDAAFRKTGELAGRVSALENLQGDHARRLATLEQLAVTLEPDKPQPAAGPWQWGTPQNSGRKCLVHLHSNIDPDIWDAGWWNPGHKCWTLSGNRPVPDGWRVVAYAEITRSLEGLAGGE